MYSWAEAFCFLQLGLADEEGDAAGSGEEADCGWQDLVEAFDSTKSDRARE
jgi:hypothetical protein